MEVYPSISILHGLNGKDTYADVEVDDAVGGGLSVVHGVRPLVGVHVARHDDIHLVPDWSFEDADSESRDRESC